MIRNEQRAVKQRETEYTKRRKSRKIQIHNVFEKQKNMYDKLK